MCRCCADLRRDQDERTSDGAACARRPSFPLGWRPHVQRCATLEGGAGRHDVVHRRRWRRRCPSATEARARCGAAVPLQLGLRPGIALAQAQVESLFFGAMGARLPPGCAADARGPKRRNHAVAAFLETFGKHLASNGASASSPRNLIAAPRRPGSRRRGRRCRVVCRRLGEAAAAERPLRRGQRATRAQRRGEPRQFGAAGVA